MNQPSHPIEYRQVTSGRWETVQASVVMELPISLTVNGEHWLTLMCTPANLEALAVGFLFNEGLISLAEEIADVRLCEHGDNVDVWLTHNIMKPSEWRRTTGCTGGFTSVLSTFSSQPPSPICDGVFTPSEICQLMMQLLESQDVYRTSGGIHTSALSDGKQIILVAEDIGRHNTLDKIAGRMILERNDLKTRILLSTGRISSEMLQKSARMGACMVISRTAASHLAIQLAEAWGITLIGYTRRDRFNVYSHAQRILGAS
jgi:FdhD protein